MALEKVKPSVNSGKGGSRRAPRAVVKAAAKKARRVADKKAIQGVF
jgi:hypothetical protein